MKSAEIREAFLQYFKKNDHTIVPSSTLIPGNDPTLLFTNAGMVQFKDVFLGEDKRSYKRATSSQRCVRAGGKHNDLENVGYTARHHTFFEMLGNFSFGDYFKRDAIKFGWEFLTVVLKLPAEKLWVTVHISDDEAASIWLEEIGVDPQRFSRLDEDNFWQMGDTGPCGPSSEIFFDHGANVPGGPPGSEDDDLDRYIEIWNLVFMQYERQPDGTLVPLPKPSVDTGMGLERIAAVMQGVHSNYDIDLFQYLLNAAAQATATKDMGNKSLRVIADHIRSCAFLIADGVVPSNEGRGSVLRRIIRRAIRHGNKLGQKDLFFHKMVVPLAEVMGEAYPELRQKQNHIESVLRAEEEQFSKTLDKGMKLLHDYLEDLSGNIISGDMVFKLHDTYGFPSDMTADIAREKNLTIDQKRFDQLYEEQRKQSQESGKFDVDYTDVIALDGETDFTGYSSLNGSGSVVALLRGNENVSSLTNGEEGAVVLDKTPFYGESGGQAGDTGYLKVGDAKFEVHDCQKHGDNHLHIGTVVSGSVAVADLAEAVVDEKMRRATALNHSATHLLHAALRQTLGNHVTQKGSLVDSEKLRFDFSHSEQVSEQQLNEISRMVNAQIRLNSAVTTELCDMDEARDKGAMMLFGEKYGESVRVLTMGDGFSVELCGGTHVERTGDIGLFKIVAESGISAGVRRIEAVTGDLAIRDIEQSEQYINEATKLLKASPGTFVDKISHMQNHQRQLEKELVALKSKMAAASADDWLSEATEKNGIKVLVKTLEGVDAKSLRDTVDQLKNKLGSSIVVVAAKGDDKVAVAAGVSKDCTSVVKAGDIVKKIAAQLGGKGGGRPDFAQGGGADVGALPGAMNEIQPWIVSEIASQK